MVKLIGDVVVTDAAVGPFVALVVESITNLLALLKLPIALVSMEIFAVRPAPLLSAGEATAWFDTMMTTLPSAFCTGNTSTWAVFEFVESSSNC